MNSAFQKIISNKKYLTFGSLIILAGGYYWYHSSSASQLPLRYTTSKVAKTTVVGSIIGTGQVSTLNKVEIKPLNSGIVKEVKVKSGDIVKVGQVLVTLDQRSATSQYIQAKANYDKIVNGLSTSDYNYYQGSIKSVELALEKARADEANNIASAQGDVDNTYNNLKLAEGGENSQIVTQAYQGGVIFLQATLAKLQEALTAADNILGIDNTLGNDNFKKYLSLLDTSKLDISKSDYIFAKESIQKLDKLTIILNSNSAHTEIDNSFKLAEDSLQKSNTLLSDMSAMLTATVPVGTITQSSLDTMKSNIGSARSSITSQYTSLLTEEKSISDDKNSYNSYKIAYDKAKRSLDIAKADAANNINAKEVALQQAKDSFDSKQKPRPEDVETVKAQLMEAQNTLSNTVITAPFDGQVAILSAQKGDQVGGSTAVATLITQQKLAQVTLNEVDVAKVKVGQKATLTFDAVPDITVAGQVAQIDTIGTVTQGVVNYTVQINFQTDTEAVKPGMSVSAAIITDIANDVLALPVSAVKSSGNQSYVELLNPDDLVVTADNKNQFTSKIAPKKQNVEVGLASDTMIEITSGLSEGDTVVIQTIDPNKVVASTSNNSAASGIRIPGLTGGGGGGGNFGGGNRGGGGR
ncbi:MAG: efflux RND transporter periplasmic adaptor subunit [Candidatus Magasanikbacteria bacterium]|nr:efflux RND transporter periplasmic adaptor subunit [Candidatus Magasanikbacteria bacterium]